MDNETTHETDKSHEAKAPTRAKKGRSASKATPKKRCFVGWCCHGALQLCGGLSAGVAIVVVMLAWQLSKGPISLSFLTPHIEAAINEGERPFDIRLRQTILTWAGWERALDIRVVDVEAVDTAGTAIARIPELSFSLSGQALIFDREVAPKSIELFGPEILIQRDADGVFSVGFPEGQSDAGDDGALGLALIQEFLSEPQPGSRLRHLTRLNIVGAQTVIKDELLNKTWSAPSTDIRLQRDAIGIQGEVTLAMELDGRPAEVVVVGSYQSAIERLDLGINFDQVAPATLVKFHEALEPLAVLNAPLAGTVTLGMTLGDAPEAVGFDLVGGAGVLNVPGEIAQQVAIDDIRLWGRYLGNGGVFDISELIINAAEGATLLMPGPSQHRVPIKRVEVSGRYDQRAATAELNRLAIDTGGPRAVIRATALDIGIRPLVSFNLSVADVNLDELPAYWAPELAPDVREWIMSSLTDGTVPRLDMKGRLRREADGQVMIDFVEGNLDVTNATVDYLTPMPKVRGANGTAWFTDQRLDVVINSGTSQGLTIENGTVALTDLDSDQERAEIKLAITGPLRNTLELIDHEPLGYPALLGIKPEMTAGDAATTLELRMPLMKDLNLDQVDVIARAELANASLPGLLRGYDVNDANLELVVDAEGMAVKGDAKVAAIPVRLNWRENFGEAVAFRTILDLSGRVDDIGQVRALGLDIPILEPEYINGAMAADVRFTVLNEHDTRVEVRADLADAEINLDDIKWRKAKGTGGRAELNLTLSGDQVGRVPHFALYGGDMAVEGRAFFDADTGDVNRVDLNQLSLGRTNIKGAVIKRADGAWDMGFHGPSIDLSSFWDDMVGAGGTEDQNAAKSGLSDLVLALEVDKIWIEDDVALNNVSGTFDRRATVMTHMMLKSRLDDGSAVSVELKPNGAQARDLAVKAEDAGAFFRTFGFYDDMSGGELTLLGRFDDTKPEHPLIGRLVVQDYRIMNAPALARVIGVMALTGIADVLQGDGLGFSVLDVPFQKKGDLIEIRDARASGASLGFTASGQVDHASEELKLNGTIVPAYALNSALGRLPVLGDLFSGGDEGGGVFAANFSLTGQVDDPEVAVNPLSALAPGFLRNLFDLLDGDGDLNALRPTDVPFTDPAADGG